MSMLPLAVILDALVLPINDLPAGYSKSSRPFKFSSPVTYERRGRVLFPPVIFLALAYKNSILLCVSSDYIILLRFILDGLVSSSSSSTPFILFFCSLSFLAFSFSAFSIVNCFSSLQYSLKFISFCDKAKRNYSFLANSSYVYSLFAFKSFSVK